MIERGAQVFVGQHSLGVIIRPLELPEGPIRPS
jgi:hypothetical protein